jgi:hypothetical protein
MRLTQKGTVALYTAKVNRARARLAPYPKDIAYLGNHIDFSIHDTRNMRNVVETNQIEVYYNTHWTEYFERNDAENTFERRADEICNFNAILKPFGKTKCIDRHNIPLYQLDRIFKDKKHQEIIEDLWKASNGKPLSKGGAPRQEPYGYKSYKGVHTLSPEFFNFVHRTVFSKLWDKMIHTPLYVYQYFDEGNELDAMGNKAIHYVIEFNETRTIAFSISSHRALKACWTELNVDVSSAREKRALSHWRRACSDFLAIDFYI